MNVQGPVQHLPRIAPTTTPAPARPANPTPPAGESQAPASAASEASFWDLLTAEEREFFSQQSVLGPLTYGPRSGHGAPQQGPLGQRVDVKG